MTQPHGIPATTPVPPTAAPPARSAVTVGRIALVIAIVLAANDALVEGLVLVGLDGGVLGWWVWNYGVALGLVLAVGAVVTGGIGLRRGSPSRASAAAGLAVGSYYLLLQLATPVLWGSVVSPLL
jgi:hypothetical protein